MSTTTRPAHRAKAAILNLPNQLTGLRLILAVVMFATIAWERYLASLLLFAVAAGTDWLDGYFARKYNQVTTLGRILDPFADKVIICGTFIFLLDVPAMTHLPWGLRAWMVVIVVGRELLVTALRSFIEERGSDFSAQMSGKLKMVFQCLAAGMALFFLHYVGSQPAAAEIAPAWLYAVLIGSIWAAVLLTVYSGIGYLFAAVRLLKQ